MTYVQSHRTNCAPDAKGPIICRKILDHSPDTLDLTFVLLGIAVQHADSCSMPNSVGCLTTFGNIFLIITLFGK